MSKCLKIELPDKVHEKIAERCQKVGCSFDEFVKESAEYVVKGYSTFNFGES